MEKSQDIKYRYDTQLLLDVYGKDDDTVMDLEDEMRSFIIDTFPGDSMVISSITDSDDVGGDKGVVKLHYHTNEPWKILEYRRSLGEIYDIVIEDMQRQSDGLQG
jgi:dihydroxyacetone kinase-like predicted kinase